jgi:hypothetical protein
MRVFYGSLPKQVSIAVLVVRFLASATLNAEEFAFKSKSEFLKVYRPAVEKYQNLMPMSLVAEVTESKNGTRMPRRQIRVFARDDYLRVDDDSEEGVQVSRVASPEQSFRAIRKTTDGPFQIEFTNESLNQMHKSCRIAALVVHPYYHFLEIPLIEFLIGTDVELKSSASFVNEDGERIVEIAVTKVVLDQSGDLTEWFYQFCFLPEQRWVLSGYRVGTFVEVRFFHESSPDATSVISKVEVEEKVGDDYIHATSYEVTNIDWSPPTLSEFTPSAFTSVHFDGGKRKNAIVVLLAAIVLIVLVMICRRRLASKLD